jgi:hypothetical protein
MLPTHCASAPCNTVSRTNSEATGKPVRWQAAADHGHNLSPRSPAAATRGATVMMRSSSLAWRVRARRGLYGLIGAIDNGPLARPRVGRHFFSSTVGTIAWAATAHRVRACVCACCHPKWRGASLQAWARALGSNRGVQPQAPRAPPLKSLSNFRPTPCQFLSHSAYLCRIEPPSMARLCRIQYGRGCGGGS